MTKPVPFRSFVTVVFLVLALATSSHAQTKPTADQALKQLISGNRAFMKGTLSDVQKQSKPAVRIKLDGGQHPYAIIVACSDSRVPPELVFNKGLGELFIIRVAGNVVAPHELGSIEYAAEHLGVPLIMVLGHTKCGAVTAAVDSYPKGAEGNIGSLVASIMPAVQTVTNAGTKLDHDRMVDATIDENVRLVIKNIKAQSPVINEMSNGGTVKIVGAKYDLHSGLVSMIPLQ